MKILRDQVTLKKRYKNSLVTLRSRIIGVYIHTYTTNSSQPSTKNNPTATIIDPRQSTSLVQLAPLSESSQYKTSQPPNLNRTLENFLSHPSLLSSKPFSNL